MSDTIFALSSGAPPAGVAVIRASGPQAFAAAAALCGPLPPPRRAALRRIASAGDLIDEGLVLRFPGPASFTGEDLVEFQVHGSRAVVAALLAALGGMPGLRPADPGEFTRRAFLSGRLDLTGVEGLADLIAAETAEQRRQALRQAGGRLREVVEDWLATLMRARAMVEAELDFADEDGVAGAWSETARHELRAVRDAMAGALASRAGERVRDGFTVVILGPPNAGKSSLLNRLAGRDAAIVAAEAGTTRDLIEVDLDLDGLAVRLVDTAGLREGGGAVEAEGMRRARRRAETADLAVWLWDRPASAAPDPEIGVPVVRVATKADLFDSAAERWAADHADLAISVASGRGIDQLVDLIARRAGLSVRAPESRLLTRERQRAAVAGARDAVDEALTVGLPGELVAEALRRATTALGRVTGTVDAEQVLDLLFREFCIGK